MTFLEQSTKVLGECDRKHCAISISVKTICQYIMFSLYGFLPEAKITAVSEEICSWSDLLHIT